MGWGVGADRESRPGPPLFHPTHQDVDAHAVAQALEELEAEGGGRRAPHLHTTPTRPLSLRTHLRRHITPSRPAADDAHAQRARQWRGGRRREPTQQRPGGMGERGGAHFGWGTPRPEAGVGGTAVVPHKLAGRRRRRNTPRPSRRPPPSPPPLLLPNDGRHGDRDAQDQEDVPPQGRRGRERLERVCVGRQVWRASGGREAEVASMCWRWPLRNC